jgi:hypothetical protein
VSILAVAVVGRHPQPVFVPVPAQETAGVAGINVKSTITAVLPNSNNNNKQIITIINNNSKTTTTTTTTTTIQ